MVIIADGIKLDFDDVLIRPKRSTLTSRSGVDIRKEYHYLHHEEIPGISTKTNHLIY